MSNEPQAPQAPKPEAPKTEAPKPEAPKTEAPKGQKYVVVHTLVGNFSQGDVVSESQLQGAKDRFLQVKAIRPATDAEAGLERVNMAAGVPNPSLEMRLAEQQAEIDRLQAALQEKEAAMQRMKAAPVPVPAPPENKGLQELVAEKDRAIAELRKQLEQAHGTAAEHAQAQTKAPPKK